MGLKWRNRCLIFQHLFGSFGAGAPDTTELNRHDAKNAKKTYWDFKERCPVEITPRALDPRGGKPNKN
jgi:hypothetical protein